MLTDPYKSSLEIHREEVVQLKKDLKEARDFIQEHHDQWYNYHPHAVDLRKQFPWLEER